MPTHAVLFFHPDILFNSNSVYTGAFHLLHASLNEGIIPDSNRKGTIMSLPMGFINNFNNCSLFFTPA